MDQMNQEIVMLENVRLSYFYGFQPFTGKNNEGKDTRTYCGHALFVSGDKNHQKISAAIQKVAANAWPTNTAAMIQKLKAQDKLCLHEGNVSKMGNEDYKDKLFVSANHSKSPTIVVSRGGVNVPVGADDPFAPYSGCWVNMQVAVYAQGPDRKPSKWGPRINAQLMGVQFLKHDTAFGGGGSVASPDEFPVQETEGADAPAPGAGAASGLI